MLEGMLHGHVACYIYGISQTFDEECNFREITNQTFHKCLINTPSKKGCHLVWLSFQKPTAYPICPPALATYLKMLIDAGSNLEAKNNHGKTALD